MDKSNKNYQFFVANEKKLKKDYANEFIIISEEKVVFHDIDFNKVVDFARGLKAGTYIIQRCETNKLNSVQMFHTRVTF